MSKVFSEDRNYEWTIEEYYYSRGYIIRADKISTNKTTGFDITCIKKFSQDEINIIRNKIKNQEEFEERLNTKWDYGLILKYSDNEFKIISKYIGNHITIQENLAKKPREKLLTYWDVQDLLDLLEEIIE